MNYPERERANQHHSQKEEPKVQDVIIIAVKAARSDIPKIRDPKKLSQLRKVILFLDGMIDKSASKRLLKMIERRLSQLEDKTASVV